MGYYLNNAMAFELYKSEVEKPYFVDKSLLLEELFPLIEQGNNHICITRPRRFGKSVAAAMIGAFLGKGCDSSDVFRLLKISQKQNYCKFLNQCNVIYIDFSKMNPMCNCYLDYITDIIELLREDLQDAFPNISYRKRGSVSEDLRKIYNHTGQKFVFVFDEWDYIFHKSFITEEDRKNFINFLAVLTKDQAYVSLTYMTGVLPIAKYSSGSTINNFDEYTMATQSKFGEYFGFTDKEVDELFGRYQKQEQNPGITRTQLELWYDGYSTVNGVRMYNPRSVVKALLNNQLASYWTASGPYSEIADYIVKDVAGVKADIALMIAGEEVPVKMEEYAATAMHLSSKDEIFSAMVVYGFLTYNRLKRTVRIPNKELMDEFAKTVRKEKSFGYIYRLAQVSERMLEATLKFDTETMEKLLEFVHNTETPILSYNNEVELSAVVNLIYLAARDKYRVEREDKAGIGYVDFIFYPYNENDDCIILELKVDATPEAAIAQIKNKQYALKFKGKIADKKRYTRRILAVGISYKTSDKRKAHQCKIEIL